MSDAMRQLQEFLRRNRASSPSCTGQDQRHESIITNAQKLSEAFSVFLVLIMFWMRGIVEHLVVFDPTSSFA